MSKNLSVKLTINADGNVSGVVKGVNSDLKKMQGQAEQTAKATSSLGSSLMQMARYASVPIGAGSLLATLSKGDQFRLLEQRIRNATSATGDFSSAYQALFDIAQRTSSAFEVNVALFESIARTAPEIGATTDEVLALTETLQNLGQLSGASQAQMSNAMLQFGQAMAGGVMRAEEFNSILENTPEIANRIALGMGKTVGELRLAVLEGEVLSQDVFNSLLSQSEAIADQARDIPLTISQAVTQLDNAWEKYIGESDNAAGSTKLIAETIQSVSNNLDTLTNVGMAAFIAVLGHGAGKLAQLSAAKVADIRATSQAAAAEKARLAGLLALADRQHAAAIDELNLATYRKQSAVTATQLAVAEKSRVAAFDNAVGKQMALREATAAYGAAAKVATPAVKALSSAMAFLGGPVGLALTAAAGVYAFREELGLVKAPAVNAAEEVDKLTHKINDLTAAQARQRILNSRDAYEQAKLDADKYAAKIEYLKVQLQAFPRKTALQESLIDAKADYDTATQTLKKYDDALKILNDITLKEQGEMLAEQEKGFEDVGNTAQDAAEKVKDFDFVQQIGDLNFGYANLNKSVIDVAESEAYLNAIRKGATEDQAFEIATRTRWYLEEKQAIEARAKAQEDAENSAKESWELYADSVLDDIESLQNAEIELAETRRQNAIDAQWAKDNKEFDKLDAQDLDAAAFAEEVDNLALSVDSIGDAWTRTGDRASEAIANMIKAHQDFAKQYVAAGKDQQKLDELRFENEQKYQIGVIDFAGYKKNAAKIDQKNAELSAQNLDNQINLAMGLASAVRAGAKEGSDAAEKAQQVEQALAITQGIRAVIRAWGDPYPLNLVSVPLTIASVGQLLGQMGASFSAGAATLPEYDAKAVQVSQGTGTVLGDPDAKSDSIDNSLDLLEDIGVKQFAELRSIDAGVRDLVKSFDGVVKAISVAGYGRFSAEELEIKLVNSQAYTGFLGNALSSIFGGSKKQSLTDSGIDLSAATLGEAMANRAIEGFSYGVIKTVKDGGWFGSDKTSYRTQLQDLDESVEEAFGQVFGYVGETVIDLGEQLGFDLVDQVTGYAFDLEKISLKDLTADEQLKEINAVVSAQTDLIIDELIGSVTNAWQRLGEGDLETAMRLVVEKTMVESVLRATETAFAGDTIALSQTLGDMAGGIEKLRDASEAYYDAFFTDQEKQADRLEDLTALFGDLGYELPTTVEALRRLVAGLDLTTKAGQSAYTAILGAADSLSTYFDTAQQAQADFNRSIVSGVMDDLAQNAQSSDALANAISSIQNQLADYQAKQTPASPASQAQDSAQIDSNNALLDVMQEQLSVLSSVESSLERARTTLFKELIAQDNRGFAAGMQMLREIQSGERAGSEVTQALELMQTLSEDDYATSADYLRDKAQAYALITEMEADFEAQLDPLEKQIKQLEMLNQSASEQYKATASTGDSVSAGLAVSAESLVTLERQLDVLKAIEPKLDDGLSLNASMIAVLQENFERIDANGDQQVTLEEFQEIFASVADKETLKALFGVIDRNGDGIITEIEALSGEAFAQKDLWISSLLPVLEHISTGQLTRDQMVFALNGLATEQQAKALFAMLDADNDGFVTLLEAQTGLLADFSGGLAETLRDGYTEIDATLDGLIDWQEFHSAFDGLATDSVLLAGFQGLDVNLDGFISRVESNYASSAKLVESAYQAILNRQSDTSGQAFWTQALAQGQVTEESLKEEIAQAAIENNPDDATSAVKSVLNALYQELFGRDLGQEGLEFWGNALLSGQVSVSELRTNLLNAAKSANNADWRAHLQRNGGVPAFASGGLHAGGIRLVGENGPELEFTGPSRIVSNTDTRKLLDNSRLEGLLERLIQRVEQLEEQAARTALATQDSADLLNRFSRGLPTYNIEVQ